MTTTTSLSTSANRDQLTTLLDHTAQRSQQRCCFLLRVRPERLAEYIEVHQHVWQDMRDALSNAGWRRYSLFLRPEDGLVVGYWRTRTSIHAGRRRWPSTSSSPAAVRPRSLPSTSTSRKALFRPPTDLSRRREWLAPL